MITHLSTLCKESVENEVYPFCDNGEHPACVFWPIRKMKNLMGLHEVF